MNLMSVYDRLPVFAQNIAFSYMGGRIQRTRFGKGFGKMLTEFESHSGWSRDQLISWRNERLREIAVHCYETVPFYRGVMDEGGINPASIKDEESLKALPIITKADVKANPSAFVSSKTREMNTLHVHTSGTTGSGFQFDSTVDCQQAQFACFWRYYRSHGLDLGTWQAQFSSRQAVPQRVCTPPFWRIDKPGRRYYMSAFHESPANMRAYYNVICENRFPWISGYPSLMVLLAQWMNERDLSFDFVKAVTCGAENLLEHQADAMERAFGVRPVQTYGQTENVAVFSQAPDGRILVDEDFSVVEFQSDAVGGGVSCCGFLPVQLRDAASALRHGRHCAAGRSGWGATRGGFYRRPPRGLRPFTEWHEGREARPCLQGHAALPGSPDLSGGRLFPVPSCCGRAVSMRRRREDSARSAEGINRHGASREVRVSCRAAAFAVEKAPIRGFGCGRR